MLWNLQDNLSTIISYWFSALDIFLIEGGQKEGRGCFWGGVDTLKHTMESPVIAVFATCKAAL